MSVIEKESPGVYSDYENSGTVWANKTNTKVGLVASILADVGTVYNISKISQAKSAFGSDSLVTNLCKTVLQNGDSQVVLVSAGNTGSGYESAFSVIESQDDIGVVICDSELLSVHTLLMNSVVVSSQNLKEQIGIAACSSSESNKEIWASSFNNERMILVAQNSIDDSGSTLSGCILAAALAGVISKMKSPANPLNGVPLKGITKLASDLNEDDIDNYISLGITPFEVVADKVKIIRAVTSKTKTNGVLDESFKEINVILIIDEIVKEIRTLLKSNFVGAKTTSNTRKAMSSQTALKLQEFLNKKIITDYALPELSLQEGNTNVCSVNLDFSVGKVLNQVHITADILI
ncbi:MAG: hypothetical protein RUMPE_00872 [Eubacteriales bacterium SKADARSKE-1]|nr:hypothetical protein [Eubacteriales bacterium SKADARSKE-1]